MIYINKSTPNVRRFFALHTIPNKDSNSLLNYKGFKNGRIYKRFTQRSYC